MAPGRSLPALAPQPSSPAIASGSRWRWPCTCAQLSLVSGGLARREEADSLVARGAASAAEDGVVQLSMDRRRFLAALAGGVVAAPLAAEAQQVPGRRIGVLALRGLESEGPRPGPLMEAFLDALR